MTETNAGLDVVKAKRSASARSTSRRKSTSSVDRGAEAVGERFIRQVVALNVLREELRDELPPDVVKRHIERLERLEKQSLQFFMDSSERASGRAPITVAVVGDFSAGKSTFINALLGRALCPVDFDPTTSSVTYFSYGDNEQIEQTTSGGAVAVTLDDYRKIARHHAGDSKGPFVFRATVPSPLLQFVTLVDTPGFNNPANLHDTKVTHDAVSKADVLLVVMDISKGNPTASLLGELERMVETARLAGRETPTFLLINQADKLPPKSRERVQSNNEKKYGHLFRKVMLLSSKELSRPDDQLIIDNLQRHADRMALAILRRDPLEVRIEAGLANAASVYRVALDGVQHELPPHMDADLASRGDLVQLFQELGKERKDLLEMRTRREQEELASSRGTTLSELQIELQRMRSNAHDNIIEVEAEAWAQRAEYVIRDALHGLIQDALPSIKCSTRKVSNWFHSKNYFQVKLKYSKAIKNIQQSGNDDRWSRIWDVFQTVDVPLRDQTAVLHDRAEHNLIEKQNRAIAHLEELLGQWGDEEEEFDSREKQDECRIHLEEKRDIAADVLTHGVFTAIFEPMIAAFRSQIDRAVGGEKARSDRRQEVLNDLLKDIDLLMSEK
jgi:ribosome biogenesis GTPase A